MSHLALLLAIPGCWKDYGQSMQSPLGEVLGYSILFPYTSFQGIYIESYHYLLGCPVGISPQHGFDHSYPEAEFTNRDFIYWNLQLDLPPGFMSYFTPWVRERYSVSPGISLSCCRLDLLKCIIPGLEHTLLEEGENVVVSV